MPKFYQALKKYGAVPVASGLTALSALPAYASGGGDFTASDFQPVMDAITAQITVGTVIGILAAGVAAVIGLVFMWWGGRKLVKMFFSAFRKGKATV